MGYFISLLINAIAVVLVLSIHEFAHAFVATKCGDGTPKLNGRLTLNPAKHIDPMGFVLCVLAGFGWAKPVPINPNNFKSFRKGLFLTSIAGVVANLIVSFLIFPLFLVTIKYGYTAANSEAAIYVIDIISGIFYQIYALGLCLFVFNLLPFYPLDGFRVVESLTRYDNPVQRFLRTYGNYILLFLLFESFICNIVYNYTNILLIQQLNIMHWVINFAVDLVGWPISAFWGLFI